MNNSLTLNEYEFTSKDTSWTQLPELNYGNTNQKLIYIVLKLSYGP